MFETVLADIRAPLERDPAARGYLDVVLSYPGFHAVTAHRAIHALHRAGVPLLPRFLSHLMRFATGIEIHPGATIGSGFFIDHGMGVVIGETAELGENVTIYQGVTLGGTSLQHGKRHPTLADNVTVGVNAAVLGAITIGENSRVGAGSVVVKDVPPNSTVIGVPGRIVIQDGKPVRAVPSRPQVEMPDPTAQVMAQLLERIEQLEAKLAELSGARGPSAFRAIDPECNRDDDGGISAAV
ncbi:MAG: serine O-acetyltransferase [Vulcanimicrobiaceae bacterium]